MIMDAIGQVSVHINVEARGNNIFSLEFTKNNLYW